MGGIATGKHMTDDEVYALTKSFWEQAEETRKSTPWLRHVQLDAAIDHLNLPLHPGAESTTGISVWTFQSILSPIRPFL